MIEPVPFELALPPNIKARIFFHVSLLKKYVYEYNHIIDWNMIQGEPKGYLQVKPMHILDRKVTMLENQDIGYVKVQWTHYGPEDVTWEMEYVIWEEYPHFF